MLCVTLLGTRIFQSIITYIININIINHLLLIIILLHRNLFTMIIIFKITQYNHAINLQNNSTISCLICDFKFNLSEQDYRTYVLNYIRLLKVS